MSARPIYYVLSSHWDREWYLPFQAFRQRMVSLLDHLLEGFSRGEIDGPFTLDGQCIPVEDYLEIRPENRSIFLALVAEGKIRLGPWYVMPDEFLVSGESLIRNLLFGRSLARNFGGQPSDVGFLCDMFGHTAQMPQIFGGFGIRSGFIWRGTNNYDVRHVRWRGPDGTEILCYRQNYCDFSFKVRGAGEPEGQSTSEEIRSLLERYLEKESAATELSPVLLFDGGDHQFWDKSVYKVIREFQSKDRRWQIVHVDLDEYCAEMARDSSPVSTVLVGELREPSSKAPPDDDQWLIPGCLSSRVWIKQENACCENLLTSWAEPWTAFLGKNTNCSYLEISWRWLLQNHPHDSMGGCSVDQVHEDMKYRFSQSRQIAENITLDLTSSLASQIGDSLSRDEVRCVIFNSLPTSLEGEIIEVDVPIPETWKIHAEAHNFDFQPNFYLEDEKGSEVSWFRISGPKTSLRPILRENKFPQVLKPTVLRVALCANLPACGYVALKAKENKDALQVRHPITKPIVTSDCALDNGILKAEISQTGEVTLTDLRSGNTFHRLLGIEDSADIGDGWCYAAPSPNEFYTSRTVSAQMAIVTSTPYMGRARVSLKMEIPEEFDWANGVRSGRKIAVEVEHTITLKKNADVLEVETRINNLARDHRMRVLFPSGVGESSHWLTDAAFDVVERPIALRSDNHTYREQEVETKPMQTWMAVFKKGRGLAVFTEGGMLEGATRDIPERPLALTLFRSTKRTVFTDGEPGGQLIGPMKFRYAIAPLEGPPDRSKMALLSRKLAGGIRCVTVLPEEEQSRRAVDRESLASSHSFLQIGGNSVMTSFQLVGNAFHLRIFNPNEESSEVTVDVSGCRLSGLPLTTARVVDFEGTVIGDGMRIVDGCFTATLRKKQIATYLLAPAS